MAYKIKLSSYTITPELENFKKEVEEKEYTFFSTILDVAKKLQDKFPELDIVIDVYNLDKMSLSDTIRITPEYILNSSVYHFEVPRYKIYKGSEVAVELDFDFTNPYTIVLSGISKDQIETLVEENIEDPELWIALEKEIKSLGYIPEPEKLKEIYNALKITYKL